MLTIADVLDTIENNRLSSDSERSARQWVSVKKWISANNYARRATIECATGYGKTRCATHILKLIRMPDPDRTAIIVVPTLQLKAQWEEGLHRLGLLENSQVYVINSLVKLKSIECDILILDEIHRYAAATFSKVFSVARYKWILGLTATLARLDGKHDLLEKYAPIVDRVTLQECKRKGYIAPYREYNLGLEMSAEEREEYLRWSEIYGSNFDKFGRDFDLMKSCTYENPSYRDGQLWVPPAVRHARSMGWQGNSNGQAYENFMHNKSAPRGQKRSVWGNEAHPYSPARMIVYSIQGMRAIREMRKFINMAPSKLLAAHRLALELDRKTITFAEITETADTMCEMLSGKAVSYHSNLLPEARRVLEEKEYKTQRGRDAFIARNEDYTPRDKRGKYYAQRHVIKKISATQLRQEALHKVMTYKRVKVICTAKALDQGFDYPGVELGIIMSRTSSPTQQTQRVGRVVRAHTFDDGTQKSAVVINIYLKDTKDYNWLRNAQGNSGTRWVDSVDEILELENAIEESLTNANA